jgi:hypothetical protein
LLNNSIDHYEINSFGNFTFDCPIHMNNAYVNDDDLNIEWYKIATNTSTMIKIGERLNDSEVYYQINRKLHLKHVNPSHSGVYICEFADLKWILTIQVNDCDSSCNFLITNLPQLNSLS